MSKICTRCGQEKPLTEYHRRRYTDKSGYRSACKACTKIASKRYQQKYLAKRQGSEEDLQKQRIRAKTRSAVEQGKLTPKPCIICGEERAEAHHLDYYGPEAHLKVVWYCKSHHALEHGIRAWTKQIDLFADSV